MTAITKYVCQLAYLAKEYKLQYNIIFNEQRNRKLINQLNWNKQPTPQLQLAANFHFKKIRPGH